MRAMGMAEVLEAKTACGGRCSCVCDTGGLVDWLIWGASSRDGGVVGGLSVVSCGGWCRFQCEGLVGKLGVHRQGMGLVVMIAAPMIVAGWIDRGDTHSTYAPRSAG